MSDDATPRPAPKPKKAKAKKRAYKKRSPAKVKPSPPAKPAPSPPEETVEIDGTVYSRQALEIEQRRRAVVSSTLESLKFCWWGGSQMPLKVGIHTKAVCTCLDLACQWFEQGVSSYWQIKMPVRHGKSSLCSEFFPAYWNGRMAHRSPEVILATREAELSEGLFERSKAIIESEEYRQLFPFVRPSANWKKSQWQTEVMDLQTGKWGLCHGLNNACGIRGGVAGHGASLLILDDPFKNVEEASSAEQRSIVWKLFSQELMMRLAPVHVVMVIGTPRHEDDPYGRIRRARKQDPSFPLFHDVIFGARGPGTIDGKPFEYPTEYLHESRFGKIWYERAYAVLRAEHGRTGAAALLDCRPIVDGGEMFDVSRIERYNPLNAPVFESQTRGWDLASTEKELAAKGDPDFTAGAKVALTRDEFGAPVVWITDLVYGQWAAPKRDAEIEAVTRSDGSGTRIAVEDVGGYRDTLTRLMAALPEYVIDGVTVRRDKMQRAERLMKLMADGRVRVPEDAPWFDALRTQFQSFPRGAHDDLVDAVTLAVNHLLPETSDAILLKDAPANSPSPAQPSARAGAPVKCPGPKYGAIWLGEGGTLHAAIAGLERSSRRVVAVSVAESPRTEPLEQRVARLKRMESDARCEGMWWFAASAGARRETEAATWPLSLAGVDVAPATSEAQSAFAEFRELCALGAVSVSPHLGDLRQAIERARVDPRTGKFDPNQSGAGLVMAMALAASQASADLRSQADPEPRRVDIMGREEWSSEFDSNSDFLKTGLDMDAGMLDNAMDLE